MSITVLPNAYASPPRGAAPSGAGDARPAVPDSSASASRAEAPSRARRHPLMDAMLSVVGTRDRASSDAPVESTAPTQDALQSDTDQAVARFAHALIGDLRQLSGTSTGAGFDDLGGSVEALAVKAVAQGAARTPASGQTTTSRTGTAAPAASAVAKPEEVVIPPQPDPLTPTSAAVHLMQVPSSYLMEAYAALRQSLPGGAGKSSGNEHEQLAGFLDRLSKSLPAAAGATPALGGLGGLVDTEA